MRKGTVGESLIDEVTEELITEKPRVKKVVTDGDLKVRGIKVLSGEHARKLSMADTVKDSLAASSRKTDRGFEMIEEYLRSVRDSQGDSRHLKS